MQEGRALLSEAEEAVSQHRYAAAHAALASAAAKLRLARDEPGLARVRELEVLQHSLCMLTKPLCIRDEPGLARVRELEVFQYALCMRTKPLCIHTKARGLARVRDLELEVLQHFVLYVCTSTARTRSRSESSRSDCSHTESQREQSV